MNTDAKKQIAKALLAAADALDGGAPVTAAAKHKVGQKVFYDGKPAVVKKVGLPAPFGNDGIEIEIDGTRGTIKTDSLDHRLTEKKGQKKPTLHELLSGSYYDDAISPAHLMRVLRGMKWNPGWGKVVDIDEGEGVVEVSWINSRGRFQKSPGDRRWTKVGEDQGHPIVWPIKFALYPLDPDAVYPLGPLRTSATKYLHAEQGNAEVTVDLPSLKPRDIKDAVLTAIKLLMRKNPRGFRTKDTRVTAQSEVSARGDVDGFPAERAAAVLASKGLITVGPLRRGTAEESYDRGGTPDKPQNTYRAAVFYGGRQAGGLTIVPQDGGWKVDGKLRAGARRRGSDEIEVSAWDFKRKEALAAFIEKLTKAATDANTAEL